MAAASFHLSVVTPEKAVLDTEATFVAVPAHDGEVGFLSGRAPLLVKLGVGVLRAETAAGTRKLAIDGGFAEMVGKRLTVLTEDAAAAEEIDLDEARTALATALEMTAVGEPAFDERQRALERARTRIKLSS